LTAVLGLAAFWLNYSAHLLAVPIRLTPGFQSQVAFRVPRAADYRVSVFCSSSAGKEYLRKLLLGGNLVAIRMTRNGDAVPLHLFAEPLFRPGIVSTAEWGNLVFSTDGAGQEIADFSGSFGGRYEITCKVIRPVPELDQMRPQLRVELDPLFFKGDLILMSSFIVLSMGAALTALASMSSYLAERRNKA